MYNKILFKLFCVMLFFNIWFPKSGIKISGIPLTIGNLLVFVLLTLQFVRVIKNGFTKNKTLFLISLCAYYFFIRLVMITPYENGISLGTTFGFIIPLVIYPYVYFASTDIISTKERLDIILKITTYGVVFVLVYGLLQFIFGIEQIQIKGLTVNWMDAVPNWPFLKSNGFMNVNKIVSTYQNGNIFGINLLFLFPIVFEYVYNRRKNIAFTLLILYVLVGFLTLSRSVWLGIVLYLVFKFVLSNKNNTIFKKVVISSLSILILYIAFTNVPYLSQRMVSDTSELVSASGRYDIGVKLIQDSWNNGILATIFGMFGLYHIEQGAYEQTFLAVFMTGGIIGLVLWLLPFGHFLFKFKHRTNSIQQGVFFGFVVWSIVSCIEGAYWLPPTACNLFFVLSLYNISKLGECHEKNLDCSIGNTCNTDCNNIIKNKN